MKLLKLTIHNLASIEEAVIDFANGPLAEESIFLICGETGAGKSTILDAICLALYKDTPRMKRTNREAYQDQAITSLDNVQTNDCRQLVRRNAKEAWVELELEDRDETKFTARWSVDRARTGNLKKVEWQLHNHRTDESLHKDAEIEAEIHRIIGLDFEQFCRTSLLAQGEFTRFLQSNPHEKADILERLTNTDIYSQIGTRIFEHWKEHKTAYETQKIKLEGIRLLSEEEKNSLTQNIHQKEKAIQSLQVQLDSCIAQIQWIMSERQLAEKIQEAQQSYELTQKALMSDGFKEAEKLLHDWDISAEARSCHREKLRLHQQQQTEEKERNAWMEKIRQLHPHCPSDIRMLLPLLQQEESDMQNRCQALRQSIQGLQAEIGQQEEELKTWKLEEKEAQKEEYLKLHEQLQHLLSQFTLLDEKNRLVQESQAEVRTLTIQLQQLKEQSDTLQKEWMLQEQNRQIQERLVIKLREATENWAKEARQRLKEGDTCPVCGQVIDRVLSDESFQSQLEGPEKEWKQLQLQEEHTRNRYNQVSAEWKQQQRAFTSATNKQAEAEKASRELQQKMTDTSKELQLPQLSTESIEQRITTLKTEIEAINRTLKSGKEVMTAISDKQKKIQGLQQAWAKENEGLHACHLRIETYHTLNEQGEHIQKRQKALQAESDHLQQLLQAFVAEHPDFTPERLGKLASYPEEKVQDMRRRMQQTKEDFIKKETSLQDLRQEHKALLEKKPTTEPEVTWEQCNARKMELEQQHNLIHQEIGQLQQTLKQDQEACIQQGKALKLLEEADMKYQKWSRLKELFGSADGKTFRAIAQSFILKELLQNANFYLKHFTDRYQLEGQGITLTILLRDFYEGGVTRPVSTLSGGESFLISLALALGLSSLNREHLSVDTLFIDEGFGTLSSDYLQTVMDTLEKLHQLGGKRVGIISHVEGLRERIRTQIKVKRVDNSRSEVEVI